MRDDSAAVPQDMPQGETQGEEKGRMRGGHDPRALAQLSAERRRERAAQRRERQASGEEGDENGLSAIAAGLDRDIAVLEHVRDHAPLPSDRRQAAQALVQVRRAQQQDSKDDEVGRVLAWRDALAQLPPEDRLTLLRELRVQAGHAGGQDPTPLQGWRAYGAA